MENQPYAYVLKVGNFIGLWHTEHTNQETISGEITTSYNKTIVGQIEVLPKVPQQKVITYGQTGGIHGLWFGTNII